ncbi:MAG: hypothetical protein ACE5DI_04085 [Candidatus Micrarchaeia archaeon]
MAESSKVETEKTSPVDEKQNEVRQKTAEVQPAGVEKPQEKPKEKVSAKVEEKPKENAKAKPEGKEDKMQEAAAEEKPKESAEDKEKAPEKKREVVEEKIAIVPLVKSYKKSKTKRTNYAAYLLKKYVTRHMKVSIENAKVSVEVNNLIKSRGNAKPPKRVKVRLTKDKEGVALVEIAK